MTSHADRPAPEYPPILHDYRSACRELGGMGITSFKDLVTSGRLAPRYVGTKPYVLHADLVAFAESLGPEAERRAS